MSDVVATPTRVGWKVHGGILLLGLALAIPVAIADFALLGPSHGGWISLDFRGFLIGAYAALWATESLLSTVIVAISRGRSAIIVFLAHSAGVGLILLAGIAWLIIDDRAASEATETMQREQEETWQRARTDLAIISWHRVPDAETPTIEVTLRANAAGQIGAEYARRPDAYVTPYADRAMRPDEEVTLTLEEDSYSAGGDGDYVFVEWGTDGFNVPIRFCRPTCPEDPGEPDAIILELPAPDR